MFYKSVKDVMILVFKIFLFDINFRFDEYVFYFVFF